VTSILCTRSGFAGDICLSTSSLRAIKQKHPDAHLTYACWKQYSELISLSPWVDEVSAPGLYMTSSFDKLLDFRHESLMDRNPDVYWGELHARQAANLGLLDLDKMESFRPQLSVGVDDLAEKGREKPLAVLNVFSANGLNWRLWGFDKWAKLVVALKAMGYKTVQIGGKDDPPVKGIDTQLCGQTRLGQIPGILAIADLFIGIDSFAHHVACGQKFTRSIEDDVVEKIGDSTPAVLICGPVPWQNVTPRDAKTVPVFDYSFCPDVCNHSFPTEELPICEYENACMRKLSVEKVLSTIEEVKDKWNC